MFEILEHTADTGFRACAPALAGLFEQAALALESIALDTSGVLPAAECEITAGGEDLESLLVNFLSEVLFYLDGKRIAFARFEVCEFFPGGVTVRAWGEPRDAERHPARIVVKGVTYHQLRVWQEAERWCAEVYLDV
jgi:SHS2 domain-containing protein